MQLIAKLTGERLNTLYSKVDGNLLLGSLPFPEDVPRLQREGVVAVVNMCREWPGPECVSRGCSSRCFPASPH